MTTRRATRKHPHRGHKMSAAAKRKLSARLKGRRYSGRRHKGRRLTSAQRARLSARLRGRHHKGHKMTAAERARLSARMKGRKHPHRGAKGAKGAHHRTAAHSHALRGAAHHRTAHRTAGPRGHRLVHHRRGRIYPSHFRRGHSRVHSRFNHRKHPKALRAPYVAGRRHVRAWK